MAEFNPELIRALANGDKEAQQLTADLPASQKITLGILVNNLRDKENIVPVNSGMSIYAEQESRSIDYEGIGDAMAARMKAESDAAEKKEKVREEWIKKVAEKEVARARAGLKRSDR
ncbi:hypothetical protein CSV75_15925 [Sporosarcina sp. P18a]|uniref:hypothetical protein n=1 Tax=Bacillales TaxID=1385 RepID=UPI000C16E205|nr:MULTISPECIES: hypothetical protein [Bacillales]PIC78630.1 hypothetical protein CSV75_15925 [Sporosarcina sp. P18a]PLS14581.1 hypothetical protein CVD28_27435 [Bacillus sp. M6-12]